jgi:hypothetical protein
MRFFRGEMSAPVAPGDVGSYTTIAMDMVRCTLSLRMFFLLESDYGLVGRLGKCVATGGVCKVVKNPSPHVYTQAYRNITHFIPNLTER